MLDAMARSESPDESSSSVPATAWLERFDWFRLDVGTSRRICAALALAGSLVRIFIALRPIDFPDRFFIPDDTYYTLTIARALAHGLGPTSDGVHLTNGFQPLIAFLMVPVFWFTSDPDHGLRAVLLLLAVVDGALAFALGEAARLMARRSPSAAAMMSTAIWAASSVAVFCALGGLETSLSLLVSALLVLAWCKARRLGSDRWFLISGVLGGLTLLARIDTAFLVGGLGLWEIGRGRRRGAVMAGLGGAVAVAPWWLYELVRFHTVIPSSGQAVHHLMKIWMTDDRWPFDFSQLLGISLGTVLEGALSRLWELRQYYAWHGTEALILTPFVVTVTCLGIATGVRPGPQAAPLRVLLISGLILWPFYLFYLPQYGFFPRYFAPLQVTVTLLLGVGFAGILGSPEAWLALVGFGSLFVFLERSGRKTANYLILSPETSADGWIQGYKGYREPIIYIVDAAPRNAVIGSFQTGALNYFGQARRPDLKIFQPRRRGRHGGPGGHLGAPDGGVCSLPRHDPLCGLGVQHREHRPPGRRPPPRESLVSSPGCGSSTDRCGVSIGRGLLAYRALARGAIAVARQAVDEETDVLLGKEQTDVFAVDASGTLRLWAARRGYWMGPKAIGQAAAFPPGAPVAAAGPLPNEETGVLAIDQSGTLTLFSLNALGVVSRTLELGFRGQFPPGAQVALSATSLNRILALAIDRRGALRITLLGDPSSETDREVRSLAGFAPGARVATVSGESNKTDAFLVDATGTLIWLKLSGVDLEGEPLKMSTPGQFAATASVAALRNADSGQIDVFAIDQGGVLEAFSFRGDGGSSPANPIGTRGFFPPGAPLAASPEFGNPDRDRRLCRRRVRSD